MPLRQVPQGRKEASAVPERYFLIPKSGQPESAVAAPLCRRSPKIVRLVHSCLDDDRAWPELDAGGRDQESTIAELDFN